MKYIINRSVVFEPQFGTLSIQNDVLERSFTLLPPACRLLNELIKFEGKPVTREHLLKYVWEDYGFTASDANLNNNISTLRKGFETLEQPRSIILTIPRGGFQLSAHLECLSINSDDLVSQDSTGIPSLKDVQLLNAPFNKEEIHEKKNKITKGIFFKKIDSSKAKKYYFSCSLIVSIIVFSFFLNDNKISKYKISPELIYKEAGCSVYTLDKKIADYNIDLKGFASNFLKKEKIYCSEKKMDLFFEINNERERAEIYFLTKCVVDASGKYSNCENKRIIKEVIQ